MTRSDPNLLRWARHVDNMLAVAMIAFVVLVVLSLTGCATADPSSIDAMAEARGWVKAGPANNVVIFKTGDPSIPCGKQADGCEQHLQSHSIITTRQHWCSEPAGLVAHELAHVCGWVHP